MTNRALGIIDAQRGFMPLTEGRRLETDGFGELPVSCGEEIIRPLNALLGAHAMQDDIIFTTQDWHPQVTAHFSQRPNFTTTWPPHCVAGTPGAELHPDISIPPLSTRFIKGFEPLARGEDDTSYSGYYAEKPMTGESLPTWLIDRDIHQVVLAGLALDYCVGKTALDLRTKLGLDVIVAVDATRSISPESEADMLEQFSQNGIAITAVNQWLSQLEAA